MKIAHVAPLIENTGGHRILYEHVNRLRNMGHRVDLYAAGWAGTHSEEWLGMRDIKYYMSRLDYHSSNPIKLQGEYDVVIANMLSAGEECISLNHPNKVYFYQNHDPYVFKDRNERIVRKALGVYQSYKKHLVYSKALRDIVLRIYPDRDIHVCTNGVTYKKFQPFQRTKRNNPPRVCYMAAYQGILKGAKLAGQVFDLLRRQGFTTVCLMANHDPIENTDEFYSNPPFEEKAQIIASCDVFLHPSIFETWCMATMEAMALGVPVVGTDSLGIREYMTEENSVIVERDPHLICDKIVELLNSPHYDQIVENSIKTAAAHDWDLVMPKIEQTYKELL